MCSTDFHNFGAFSRGKPFAQSSWKPRMFPCPATLSCSQSHQFNSSIPFDPIKFVLNCYHVNKWWLMKLLTKPFEGFLPTGNSEVGWSRWELLVDVAQHLDLCGSQMGGVVLGWIVLLQLPEGPVHSGHHPSQVIWANGILNHFSILFLHHFSLLASSPNAFLPSLPFM